MNDCQFKMETKFSGVPVVLHFEAWPESPSSRHDPGEPAGWEVTSIEEYGVEVPKRRFLRMHENYQDVFHEEIGEYLYNLTMNAWADYADQLYDMYKEGKWH